MQGFNGLRGFVREGLPLLADVLDGRRMRRDVKAIVGTDRWNSFDRFHDTADYLVSRFAAGGNPVERYAVPTSGPDGSGRWVVQQASDVVSATLDIVAPITRRIVDFSKNPWQVVQWSAATSRAGVECDLVVVDEWSHLQGMRAGALRGKWILTRLGLWHRAHEFVRTGAEGVLTAPPLGSSFGGRPREPQLPDATEWLKLGWGGLPMEHAGMSLVALALSPNEGERLRALLVRYGGLRIHARVDIRRYVGTHDLVSGLVLGADEPTEEVWALAHSAEPGAADNASGVATGLAAAAGLERLIRAGRLPRPRRSIRFLAGYECYSFFHYLEHVPRWQPPLAGLVVDTVGHRPQHCRGRLNWHATLPASAGFVNTVGIDVIRPALRLINPGYRLVVEPFVSTEDTLVGDPKYGFPCPWLNSHYRARGVPFNAYHTSADQPALLSPQGLELAALIAAGYLYYLADADSRDVADMARRHTAVISAELKRGDNPNDRFRAERLAVQHGVALQRLERWMWGGDRTALLAQLEAMRTEVRARADACPAPRSRRVPFGRGGDRVVVRTRMLAPDIENLAPEIRQRLVGSGLGREPLFWADGRRSVADIARLEKGAEAPAASAAFNAYFESLQSAGFVRLVPRDQQINAARLRRDLRALGLKAGMDVMVHSSLSRIGVVAGGADAVIDALLAVIGPQGTLLMPSFNHGLAALYNPMTTPTTNGAIPDAFWRRFAAHRSLHGTHAVAAIGPRAEAYVEGHLEAGVWGPDSPIGRLVRARGWILCLGVTPASATVQHVAEIDVPCGCLSAFEGRDVVIGADGIRHEVPGLLWRQGPCPIPLARMEHTLKHSTNGRQGAVGAAPSSLFRADALWRIRRRHLTPVCPTCPVRPDPHWKAGERRRRTV